MNRKNQIESRIEEALNSLEGIQRATPGDFFYTRVTARLLREEATLWDKLVSFVAQPAVALAVFFAVVLSNTLVIFNHQDKNNTIVTSKTTEQNFAEEYNQVFVAVYDPENIAP